MMEHDPHLSSRTSPSSSSNKEPEDFGTTTHATEETKKESSPETIDGELHTNTTPAGEEAPSISSELLDETTDLPISLQKDEIKVMSKLKDENLIFVNRTSELRDLFNTNAACNETSRRRCEEVQEYAVPVAAMTYGAGKTALGSNYLSEMRKWAKGDNLDEDQQAALQFLKEQGHHDQLQALCADDTVSVRINSTTSLPQTLWVIYCSLDECTPEWTKSEPSDEQLIASLQRLIAFIRKTRAVFIMVDEIGKMKDTNDINKLRELWVDMHVANARSQSPAQAKPLHVYLCGRVDREIAEYMANSLKSNSPYTWHSLVLEPLRAQHVCKIRKHLDISLSTNNEVNKIVDAHIVELTAGVPRQIWRVLTAAKVLNLQLKSTDHAKTMLPDLCRELALHPNLQSDLVNLAAPHNLEAEYARMHVLSVTRTLIEYPICSRYLPLTLTCVSTHDQPRRLYQVNTAPIFTLGMQEQISKQLEVMSLIGNKWFPPKTRASSSELLVLQALYRRLMIHGLAKETFAGPNDEVPSFTLHQLLPFLKGTMPDQVLPDTPLNQDPPTLPKIMKNDPNSTRFNNLKIARGSEECFGKLFQVPKASCTSADVIIDFPLVPSVSKGIRVVEVQVKSTESQSNAVSVMKLRDDCIQKATISDNPNEQTLRVLSANMLTRALEQKIPSSGVLLLSPGECVTYERPQTPDEKKATERSMPDSTTKERDEAKKKGVEEKFYIPSQLYLVVLRPAKNKEWLENRG